MTGTLTIRLSAAQRQALRARAAAVGKTESEVLREMLDRDLASKRTVGQRAGHLFGTLDFESEKLDKDPFRAHIRRMNWRK